MPDTQTDVAKHKQQLRKQLLAMRRKLPAENAQALSLGAQTMLLQSPQWAVAKNVGLYSPVRGETTTQLLLQTALTQEKTVLLPRVVTRKDAQMVFLPCDDQTTLVPGSYGILEPDPARCPPPPAGDEWLPDLVIVPGVAFDRQGFRLGSGAGYYDRYFARPLAASMCRIGFAYGFQLMESLPVGPWDLPMHAIVTENGLHPCHSEYHSPASKRRTIY